MAASESRKTRNKSAQGEYERCSLPDEAITSAESDDQMYLEDGHRRPCRCDESHQQDSIWSLAVPPDKRRHTRRFSTQKTTYPRGTRMRGGKSYSLKSSPNNEFDNTYRCSWRRDTRGKVSLLDYCGSRMRRCRRRRRAMRSAAQRAPRRQQKPDSQSISSLPLRQLRRGVAYHPPV
jgi:hypothetical protein